MAPLQTTPHPIPEQRSPTRSLSQKFNQHGKERDIEVDAADSCKHYYCDFDGIGRNIVHGRVSALGGCGLHTAR